MPIRFALLTLLASPALAQEATGLPDSLFGIGLGGVYEYAPYGAEGSAVGSFPIQRLISARRSLHRAASLYFEPLTENAIETAMEDEVYSKIRRAELAGRGRGSGRGPAIVVR